MVDTQRFNITPDCARFVLEVAAGLSRRNPQHLTQPLEVTTYLPLDAESVTRALESTEGDSRVSRVVRGEIVYYQFHDPDTYSLREFNFEECEHLDHVEQGLTRTMNALKSQMSWSKRVCEQHELLHIAASASGPKVELSYFTSRCEIPSARVQSILNDFGAAGYIELDYDEDSDTLSYTFPPLDYPSKRLSRNLLLIERAEPKESSSPIWLILLLATVILLVIILLIRASLL